MADALAAKQAARMAKVAAEMDCHLNNCRALEDFAERRGFRRQSGALWFEGARCLIGEVWRTATDTPRAVRSRVRDRLRAAAHSFRSRQVTCALFAFVIDDAAALEHWHLAMHEQVRQAGLAVVRQEEVCLSTQGFGIVYTLVLTASRPSAGVIEQRKPVSRALPRSRGPREVGEW